MSAQSAADVEVILNEHVIGRSIRGLQVLGINALKTIDPRPDVLVGCPVLRATVKPPRLEIATLDYEIHIDLARTGRLDWLDSGNEWRPTDRRSGPTLRLLLDDGGAVDFIEPAKTKRITVSIHRSP